MPSGWTSAPGSSPGCASAWARPRRWRSRWSGPSSRCGSLEVLAHAVAGVGPRAGHARRPRRRRPAGRGLRRHAPRHRARRGVGAGPSGAGPPRRSPTSSAPWASRWWWPATAPVGTASVLGAVPGAVFGRSDALDFPPPARPRPPWWSGGRRRGRPPTSGPCCPHYLRDAETRINWETRARARPPVADDADGAGVGRRGTGPPERHPPTAAAQVRGGRRADRAAAAPTPPHRGPDRRGQLPAPVDVHGLSVRARPTPVAALHGGHHRAAHRRLQRADDGGAKTVTSPPSRSTRPGTAAASAPCCSSTRRAPPPRSASAI